MGVAAPASGIASFVENSVTAARAGKTVEQSHADVDQAISLNAALSAPQKQSNQAHPVSAVREAIVRQMRLPSLRPSAIQNISDFEPSIKSAKRRLQAVDKAIAEMLDSLPSANELKKLRWAFTRR